MKNALFTRSLIVSALISSSAFATAEAKNTYYKDWDYYREQVVPGSRGIVTDVQDGKAEDFRGNCLTLNHLGSRTLKATAKDSNISEGKIATGDADQPSTEVRLQQIRSGQNCNDAPKEVALAPEPTPVAAPVETIKPVSDSKIVFFDYNESDLTQATKLRLQSIINAINSSSEVVKVKIAGHADRIGGNSKGNVALSKRRAEAVKAYLFQTGKIKSEVVDLAAHGASKPVTDCAKAKPGKRTKEIACLQGDRRVEVIIEGLTKEVPLY